MPVKVNVQMLTIVESAALISTVKIAVAFPAQIINKSLCIYANILIRGYCAILGLEFCFFHPIIFPFDYRISSYQFTPFF